MEKNQKRFTSAGTDIEEVKRQNAQGGKSYNEVLNALSVGTNPQKVREEIAQETAPFAGSSQPQAGKTAAGTNIAEVRSQNAQAGNGQSPFANQQMREEFGQEAGPFASSGQPQAGKTVAGTNIAEVRSQNAQASTGQSSFAKQNMREEFGQEAGPFASSGQPQAGKTVAGTDIAEVQRQVKQAEQKKK